MLDRVIDAPAHQGRTDLDQAFSPGCLGGKAHLVSPPWPVRQVKLCLHFLRSGCLQSIEGCGLLANGQSCHPSTTWGSAMIVQSLLVVPLQATNRVHAQPVIWQSSLKAMSSCHVDRVK